MRQLRQRIFVNCRLEKLKSYEVDSYIDCRLFMAGSRGDIQFSLGAKRAISKKSKGIPRMINKICDYALTSGYVTEDFVIRKKHVQRALKEMGDMEFRKQVFLGGAFNHTRTGVRKLLCASVLGLAVIFSILLLPQTGKIKSFLIEKTAMLLADHSPSITNSSHAWNARADSDSRVNKQINH